MNYEALFHDLLIHPHLDAVGASVRLLLALLFGGLIGFERGRHNQAAGFRTHILIAIASCIIMEAGLFLAAEDGRSDPTRMAAQVVSGIGFLGAGAIFRFGFDVKGLTTAASLWSVSAIGLAAGAGLYFLTIIGTVFLLFVLRVLEPISHKIAPHLLMYTLRLTGKEIYKSHDELRGICARVGVKMEKSSVSRQMSTGQSTLSCHITAKPGFDANHFLDAIAVLPGLESSSLDAVV